MPNKPNNCIVYPNVINNMFRGCGRFYLKPLFSMDTDVSPAMANKKWGDWLSDHLAPNARGARKKYTIQQYKDEKTRIYSGDSIELAWFLINIRRGYEFSEWTRNIIGENNDIWCTGSICSEGGLIGIADFKIKLKAFLTDTNDKLFIFPICHMAEFFQVIQENNKLEAVDLYTMQDAIPNYHILKKDNKKFLAVSPAEIPDLIKRIFVFDTDEDKKINKFRKIEEFINELPTLPIHKTWHKNKKNFLLVLGIIIGIVSYYIYNTYYEHYAYVSMSKVEESAKEHKLLDLKGINAHLKYDIGDITYFYNAYHPGLTEKGFNAIKNKFKAMEDFLKNADKSGTRIPTKGDLSHQAEMKMK